MKRWHSCCFSCHFFYDPEASHELTWTPICAIFICSVVKWLWSLEVKLLELQWDYLAQGEKNIKGAFSMRFTSFCKRVVQCLIHTFYVQRLSQFGQNKDKHQSFSSEEQGSSCVIIIILINYCCCCFLTLPEKEWNWRPVVCLIWTYHFNLRAVLCVSLQQFECPTVSNFTSRWGTSASFIGFKICIHHKVFRSLSRFDFFKAIFIPFIFNQSKLGAQLSS